MNQSTINSNRNTPGESPINPIPSYNEAAAEYDRIARAWNIRPEVTFGLMYDFVEAGQTILDVACGSGLTAAPFYRAGLQVYGVDGAEEMLKVCRDKGIMADLLQHDLSDFPWPYDDDRFDHVVCTGLLQYFADLRPVFAEVARSIKPGGTFGFIYPPLLPHEKRAFSLDDSIASCKIYDEAGEEEIFKHHETAVRKLLRETGFGIRKELFYAAAINPDNGKEHYGRIIVAQRER